MTNERPTVADLRRYGATVPVQMAADALGVSPGTVRKAIKDGTLPAVHMGRVMKVQTAGLIKILGEDEPTGPDPEAVAGAVAESVRRALAGTG